MSGTKVRAQNLILPPNQKITEKACLQLAACADSSPREHDRELFEPSKDVRVFRWGPSGRG